MIFKLQIHFRTFIFKSALSKDRTLLIHYHTIKKSRWLIHCPTIRKRIRSLVSLILWSEIQYVFAISGYCLRQQDVGRFDRRGQCKTRHIDDHELAPGRIKLHMDVVILIYSALQSFWIALTICVCKFAKVKSWLIQ